jgi:hypothetical protein
MVDTVYEDEPQFLSNSYSEIYEKLRKDTVPFPLDLLIPKDEEGYLELVTGMPLSTNILGRIGEDDCLIHIPKGFDYVRNLGYLLMESSVYKEIESTEAIPVIVSRPPVTPLEQIQTAILENLCDRLEIDLYIYGRDFGN